MTTLHGYTTDQMRDGYLAADGVTVVGFKDRGEFTQAEAERLETLNPNERFAERETKQVLPSTKLIEFWVVRAGATSEDRARRAGKTGNARSLARPVFHQIQTQALLGAGLERGEVTHSLQFTRPRGYTLHAAFSPSKCGRAIYVRTANWSFEDEYHHWLPVAVARELYAKMLAAGYEVAP